MLSNSDLIFVLDANVFIEAKNRYYAFDIVPVFWTTLIAKAEKGNILSIDKIKDELEKGNDILETWAKKDFKRWFYTTDSDDVFNGYRQIIKWVNENPIFSSADKSDFARGADGWLVAYARAKGFIIVTHENNNTKKRKIKIPVLCSQFQVQYVDTFKMMRSLNIRFE